MKIFRIIFYVLLVTASFSSCQKEFSVENAINSSGTWEFQESAVQYKGNLDSAVIRDIGGTKILRLQGKALAGQQLFSIQLFAADSFVVGSYRASLSQSTFIYFTSVKTIFQADFLTGEFSVSITSISNNRIEGTFTGQAADSSGNPTQITLGKFSSTIDLTNNGTGGGGTTAVGTLGVTAGACTPVTPAGVYSQGTLLSASNTVQLEVSVSTPGTYFIATDTVNGVSFSTGGTFATAGVNNTTLTGSGTPIDPGDHNYTVTFGASTCVFTITFLPKQTSVGTLDVATGSNICNVSLQGVYKQGTPLSDLEQVLQTVNVTTPGTYSIATDTVNGVRFSTSGTFATAGAYNITLNGSGTPLDSGDHTFTMTFGASTCMFTVTFLQGTTTDANYFPTTANSNWAYGVQDGTPSDSILVTVLTVTPTFNGQVYAALTADGIPPSGAPDTSYFRKSGNDYFEYIDPASIFFFDESNPEEYIFLKDDAQAGDTFQSPDFTGTISSIPATAYIKMTILEKAVPATVGSLNFNDVIKVKYEYFLTGVPGVAATEERWFARDVGLIYDNIDNTVLFNIGRYTVF